MINHNTLDYAFDKIESPKYWKRESRPLARLHKSLASTLHPSVTCCPLLPKDAQDVQHGSSPLQDVQGAQEVPGDQLVRLDGEGEDVHLHGLPHLLRRGTSITYLLDPHNAPFILFFLKV